MKRGSTQIIGHYEGVATVLMVVIVTFTVYKIIWMHLTPPSLCYSVITGWRCYSPISTTNANKFEFFITFKIPTSEKN